MHGIGNDFVLIKARNVYGKVEPPDLARSMCHRRFGIGADGLMMADSSEKADVRMIYFNADGTEGEMCGNGIRCFAHFVRSRAITGQEDALCIETLADLRTVTFLSYHKDRSHIQVHMGKPVIRSFKKELEVEGEQLQVADLTLGVPHVVLFQKNLSAKRVDRLGPVVEKMPCFPEGTNVNFAQIHHPGHVSVMTWERGAGHTLACGTGICSVCTVAWKEGLIKNEVQATAEGGELLIKMEDDGTVFMTGAAVMVAEGEFIADL